MMKGIKLTIYIQIEYMMLIKDITKKYDIPANFIKIKEFRIENTIIYEVYKKTK